MVLDAIASVAATRAAYVTSTHTTALPLLPPGETLPVGGATADGITPDIGVVPLRSEASGGALLVEAAVHAVVAAAVAVAADTVLVLGVLLLAGVRPAAAVRLRGVQAATLAAARAAGAASLTPPILGVGDVAAAHAAVTARGAVAIARVIGRVAPVASLAHDLEVAPGFAGTRGVQVGVVAASSVALPQTAEDEAVPAATLPAPLLGVLGAGLPEAPEERGGRPHALPASVQEGGPVPPEGGMASAMVSLDAPSRSPGAPSRIGGEVASGWVVAPRPRPLRTVALLSSTVVPAVGVRVEGVRADATSTDAASLVRTGTSDDAPAPSIGVIAATAATPPCDAEVGESVDVVGTQTVAAPLTPARPLPAVTDVPRVLGLLEAAR